MVVLVDERFGSDSNVEERKIRSSYLVDLVRKDPFLFFACVVNSLNQAILLLLLLLLFY